MKPNKKVIIKCDYADVHRIAEKEEVEWIYALLKRFKVDPKQIELFENDKIDKTQWRNFLFEKYGILIEKDLSTGLLTIKRLNFKTTEVLLLGEWKAPEIIKVVAGKERYCELHLRTFQIV